MGQSYRLKTEIGINKTINIPLEQDFEFLEVLSLKIQQTGDYFRSCAEYGVIVGRVTANNGFGIPNARVSVFIPISVIDESNPIITSIYPYKSPEDKNEDGYRYNLLPYEKSYSTHAATGTLPSRMDVLTDPIAIEVYDKYYKFTAKTNDSGDYMIMGVPIGTRKLVMDVDLSDIGEFSLTPQDLIRMGLATEAQVAGNRFNTSTDLNSLPQIVTLQKDVDVLPLWGDPTVCQLAITRTDFDLRDEANIDIQPTATFIGSIFSSPDKFRIRKNCRPKDNLGNLCDLTAGPGQILALRQTIEQDIDGNPILEQFQLEQAGNIIDGNGTWLTELPMNLDYIITNEFGERVVSADPTIGIPTKAKFRFKIKWQQAPTLTEQTRRGYFLVPNVKEYGWTGSNDPSDDPPTSTNFKKQASSYYFGLAWSGYTDGFTGQQKIDRLNEMIDCEDSFYEFQFNRVYTVSGLIDQWKKGARGRFIGIKEIDDDSCSSTINKFPVNDGFRNFDFLFFLFSILMTIIQPTMLIILTMAHITLFVYSILMRLICLLTGFWPLRWIRKALRINCDKKDYTFRLPMITYPECQSCECKSDYKTSGNNPDNPDGTAAGVLTYLSLPATYIPKFEERFSASTDPSNEAIVNAEAMSGRASIAFKSDPTVYKMPLSQNLQLDGVYYHLSSKNLPLGERINLFNQRENYFEGKNKIRVKVEPTLNVGSDKFHYDNTITVLSNTQFESGDLLTFVNVNNSKDINWLYSAVTQNGLVTGISGTSLTTSAATAVTMTYASTPTTPQSVTYNLPYGVFQDNYKFPADVEYFQVVTAITWSEIVTKWNSSTVESFPNLLNQPSTLNVWKRNGIVNYTNIANNTYNPIDYVEGVEDQYVLVLQRGVDPYSPRYIQQYQLGNLFGTNESDSNFTFTAYTKLNIPIQVNSNNSISVQEYNQNQMFFPSYFFRPGVAGSTQAGLSFSAYTTENPGYYGLLDKNQSLPNKIQSSGLEVVTTTANGFYLSTADSSRYDLSEDLSGMGAMACNNFNINTTHPEQNYLPYFSYSYFTKTIYGGVVWSAMTINNSTKNVMRTDRLPSSDQLDGGSWGNNPSLLQQNLNFQIYGIFDEGSDISTQAFSTGASVVTADLEGQPNAITVFESFDCQGMVSLDCYTGFGSQFQINQSCAKNDAVERGCYVFLKRPLLDLFKDWGNFGEWSFRFRFFYGLCRGVLSQSFMNNWVNGSLYAFPIQVDTVYNSQNKPTSKYCSDLIYYDKGTTNFYYRSSPYNDNTNKFIGKPAVQGGTVNAVNVRNLLFPTTIMNLGMKDAFYGELSFEPSTRAYVMTELESTSYGDTSDLVNLFVISRITDESFLRQLLVVGDNGLNQLFSRNNPTLFNQARRIDGDLAQLLSINSELGNVNFSPEYYEIDPLSQNNPTNILGTASNPVIAVWFSSTTENLQTKDYLTPGRINFRATPTSNFAPFLYGNKSQIVPFYQWQLNGGSTIFGTQNNSWATNENQIVSNRKYQSLDRVSIPIPTYFQSTVSPNTNDLNRRGYIFSVDSNGNYSTTAAANSLFIVSAPFHFYFGTIKGETALDKFKTKYSIVE